LGIADSAVDILCIVEEEPGIEAPRQTRLKVAVEPKGIAVPEIRGRWDSRIGRKAANGSLLPIEEHFRTPDKPTIPGLAEREIALRNIDASQMTLRALVNLDLWRVCITHTHINTMIITEVDKRDGMP